MRHKKKLFTLAGMAMVGYWLYPDRYPVYPESDHYDPKTQTFFNAEPQQPVSDIVRAMWTLVFDEQSLHPPKPLPMLKPDWAKFLAPAEKKSFYVVRAFHVDDAGGRANHYYRPTVRQKRLACAVNDDSLSRPAGLVGRATAH